MMSTNGISTGFSDREEAGLGRTHHPTNGEIGARSMFVAVLHHICQRPYPRGNKVSWFHLS